MYIYVFRYQFSPQVTDIQKFDLQLLCVATANAMGLRDFWSGFEEPSSGPNGNYCGVIQNVDQDFGGFYTNPQFVARTAWARPPLAEFTSFLFSTTPGSEQK